MKPAPNTLVYQLFVLNIVLQMFDGTATYAGVNLGWREANPLLHTSFGFWGVAQTLLLFKALACGLLLLLYRKIPAHRAAPMLGLLAGCYYAASFLPWCAILFVALLPY
jgi:hypothetical protein